MAVSFEIEIPTTPNAAYTRLGYQVASTDTTLPQYQFVLDIYESGSSNKISRLVQSPERIESGTIYNSVTFDPSRIFQGELNFDNNWKITGSIEPVTGVKTFTVKAGEQYGTSTSSSITVYPDQDTTDIQVFPAVVNPTLIPNVIGWNEWDFYPPNVLPINIMSNTPEAKTLGPSPFTDALFVNNTDYHTITTYEFESNIGIVVYGANDTLIYGVNLYDVPAFSTVGIGPQNLLDYSMPPALLDDAWYIEVVPTPYDSYDLYLPNHPEHPCRNEYTRFAFINRYGFWDYYNVYNPVRTTTELERKSFNKPQIPASITFGSTWNPFFPSNNQYFLRSKDSYSIDTDYLNKEMSNWLEELIESPEVYIQEGSNFVPIVLTNSTYQHNNSTSRNKLFQYTIEWVYANPRRSRL